MSDPFMPTSKSNGNIPPPGAAMDRPVARSRGLKLRRWRWPLAIVLAAVSGIIGVQFLPASGTLAVPGSEVTVGTTTSGVFQDYLPVIGTVTPLHSVFLDAVAAGQVSSVAVQDGASVQARQVLATLTNPQLELDVSSREAEITGQLGSASAQRLSLQQSLATETTAIAQAGYDLQKAQRDLSVHRALQAQGFESDAAVRNSADDASYDSRHLALLRTSYAGDAALARTQIAEIDDTEAELRRNLEQVQSSLQALILRAPFTGRLANFNLEPGQSVHEGDQVGQVDSADAFRVDAEVDEFYLGQVSEGDPATANFDSGTAMLKVSRVLPQVSNGQFHVELFFAGAAPAGLHSGETSDLRITLGADHRALLVPNGQWLSASGGNSIFVVAPDGRHAALRAITVGRRNQDQVEVTAGLAPGDRVITSDTTRFQKFSNLLLQ